MKVLLLGDSIRGQYWKLVRAALPYMDVCTPGTGKDSGYTLSQLDRWLQPTPDIVHWNNGLWDVGHLADLRDPPQIPLEQYLANLKAILSRLRETGAVVIWATTTPVGNDGVCGTCTHLGRRWYNHEIVEYNRAAEQLMVSNNLMINDLYVVVNGKREDNISDDDLHLSVVGAKRCARAVVEIIQEAANGILGEVCR